MSHREAEVCFARGERPILQQHAGQHDHEYQVCGQAPHVAFGLLM